MLLEVFHKIIKRLPFRHDYVPLSEINFLSRPDIFIAYEWILNDYQSTALFCKYMERFSRKKMDTKRARKKFKKLYRKMKFEYMYLFYPIEFYASPDGYIGLNLSRLSILLALGYRTIPCRIVNKNDVTPSCLNKIEKGHFINRMRRLLGPETDRVLKRIKGFIDDNFVLQE